MSKRAKFRRYQELNSELKNLYYKLVRTVHRLLQVAMVYLCNVHACAGKRYVLVCWDSKESDDCTSVSAVPATRVSTTGVLDSSIGEPCTVRLEEKEHN